MEYWQEAIKMGRVAFHHYNYVYPGENVPEGIKQRVRQGVGGPTTLERGADIIGHYHIGNGGTLRVGDVITMPFGEEGWEVRVTQVGGVGDHMIKQEDEDEVGYEVGATCIRKIK